MCSGQLPVKRGPPSTTRACVCVTYQVPASQQQGRPASLCLWSLQPHLFTFLAGIVPSSQWALCTSESEGMIADTTPNMIIARDSWDSTCSVCHSSFLTGLPYGFPWVPFVTASLVLATAGVPSPSITGLRIRKRYPWIYTHRRHTVTCYNYKCFMIRISKSEKTQMPE